MEEKGAGGAAEEGEGDGDGDGFMPRKSRRSGLRSCWVPAVLL